MSADCGLRRGWFADWDQDQEGEYGWQPCLETGMGHIPCFQVWFKTEAECNAWITDNVIGVGWLPDLEGWPRVTPPGLLDNYDPVPGLVARGVMSDEHDPDSCEADLLHNNARSAVMKICDCAPDCRERIECEQVGEVGHGQCGWCFDHGKARHICLCPTTSEESSTEA